MQFSLTNGLLSTSPASVSAEIYNGKTSHVLRARRRDRGLPPTATRTGSSGACRATATACRATLHAYDPSNLAHEYYTSDQAGTRDQLDPWLKFTIPLVANGRVYVVSAGQLTAFGLLP